MKPLVTLALACALFSGVTALLEYPNGKKCFTCMGNDCTRIEECTGSEDLCFKASGFAEGRKKTMKGCASKFMCSGFLNFIVPWHDLEMSCCEGNLCNNALRIGQSDLFLLLVPLASVILFN